MLFIFNVMFPPITEPMNLLYCASLVGGKNMINKYSIQFNDILLRKIYNKLIKL